MMDHELYGQALAPLLRQAAGYARSILRNRQQAQDAVQQAALRGLEKLQTFDDSRCFRSWWFSILHNCCIDLLREDMSARHVVLDEVENDIPEAGESGTPDWQRLRDCMAQLTADHSEILRLKYFAELSYRELAEVLTIPKGTVMSRLHLARIALAAKMREEEL